MYVNVKNVGWPWEFVLHSKLFDVRSSAGIWISTWMENYSFWFFNVSSRVTIETIAWRVSWIVPILKWL